MKIIPAIDLLNGEVVRLRQGKLAEKIVYSKDPLEYAQRWKDQGADFLHVVDLDAAFSTGLDNFEVIQKIVATGIPLQTGGGIRDFAKARMLLDEGVSRIIIGTKAFAGNLLEHLLAKFSAEQIAVSVDVKDGYVATLGWQQTADIPVQSAFEMLVQKGIQWIIYTDISRDGMMQGAELEKTQKFIKDFPCHFIVSGGVSSLADIEKIAEFGAWGAIVGKALYEGVLSLPEAIAQAKKFL